MKSKKLFIAALIFVLCAIPMFAASSGESIVELDNWADKILELFQSSWIKAILLVALIVEAIGMVLAGQQGGGGQMIKKFAPWIIGTIILLSASSICSYFLGDLKFEVAITPVIQSVTSMTV
ncbi:MAG: TrbC/VirB2 family protein [Treponema sp.]|nr:TrbC/VirB2 family protein [Treponema sp.]